MADDGGVTCELHNRVFSLSGAAVMGVQRAEEGAKHMALGDSSVEHQSGGGKTTNLNCLGSVWEKVQYPFGPIGPLKPLLQTTTIQS